MFDFDNKIFMGIIILILKGEGSRSVFFVDLDSVFMVNSVVVNGELLVVL